MKNLLSIYFVPGTLLGAKISKMNKKYSSSRKKLLFQGMKERNRKRKPEIMIGITMEEGSVMNFPMAWPQEGEERRVVLKV
jgi:hypothetical protein